MASRSPARFGSAQAPGVRFVRADGAEYAPPAAVVYTPSDPPAFLQARASPERDHSPWMRDDAEPGSSRGRSPGVKRTRSPGLQRDSLRQRYSPGRPGSRRHQRWSNDQALREDLTDEDLRELYAMDWRSALSELFVGEDKMQKWQDFCEASEEEQLRVLMGLRSDRGRSRLERRLQPQERFNRIDRRVKALLKRGVGTAFVEEFETRLRSLLYGSGEAASDAAARAPVADSGEQGTGTGGLSMLKTRGGASLVLNDSMERLLAHSVCLYHAVQSFTRDCQGPDAAPMEAVGVGAGGGEHGEAGKMLIMVWPQRHSLPAVPPQGQAPPRVHASPWALEAPSLTLLQLLQA